MRAIGAFGMAAVLALAGCGSPGEDPAGPDAVETGPVGPASAAATPQGRFEPRNECIELPGAKAFFLALENAIRMRDADLLLRSTSADVKLDFGGGGGLTTLRERLSDKEGELWKALDSATTMGCAHADNGDLVMPWYADQPMDDIDVGRALIVTGKAVPVRSAPAADGPQVGAVSWDAVELVNGLDPKAAFQEVKIPDGTEGYIASDMLRSPLAYRLRAAPAGDGWQIVSFVKGD